MAIGSCSRPEYWPPVQQLMPSGWYRAGSIGGAEGTEWGFRMVQTDDAETALRCWISSVEEQAEAQRSGTDCSTEQVGAARETTDVF